MFIFQKSGLKPPTSVGKDPTVRRRRSKPLNPSTLVGGGSVTGSLQMGENLRVNVELVDAVNENNVWVDQMDGKVDNLFLFQDQITANIFENFQINLLSSLIGRGSSKFSSVEEIRDVIRFRKNILMGSKDGYLAAQGLADQIYSKNNASGPANVSKGWLNFAELMMGITKDRQKRLQVESNMPK